MGGDSPLIWARTVGEYILLVIVLLLLWVVVSPIAYGLRYVLHMLGMPDGLARLAVWLRALTPVRLWNMGWTLLPVQPPAGGELRLVVDQRLDALERSIGNFADSTRKACGVLAGLGSSTGPAGLAQQVVQLRQEIEKLGSDETPYDIDDALVAESAEEISARSTRRLLLIGGFIIVLINGGMLSEAFRNLGFNSRIGPVSQNVLMAAGYVVVEIFIGILLRMAVAKKNRIGAAAITLTALAAITIEIYVTDQIGLGRYQSISAEGAWFFERHVFGLFGFMLGSVNLWIGYYHHEQGEVLHKWQARKRIVQDATAWNSLLLSLPERLDRIRNHVGGAQSSLDNYLVAMGGHSDSFSGAVDAVAADRGAVLEALRDANLPRWPQWIGSVDGDRRTSDLLSIGFALLTLALGGAFIVSFASEVSDAFPRGSEALIGAGTVGAAIALYLAGLHFFSKIQLLELPDRRTAPLRMGEVEKAVAVVSIVAATIAVWGFSIYAHGWKGLPVGALNSLLAAGLVGLGSQWDRFWRGLFGGAVALLNLILAALFLAGGMLVQAGGWVLVAFGKLLLLVLGFMGLPTELVTDLVKRRKRHAQPLPA
jgi:hypothetical protein